MGALRLPVKSFLISLARIICLGLTWGSLTQGSPAGEGGRGMVKGKGEKRGREGKGGEGERREEGGRKREGGKGWERNEGRGR